MKISDIAQCIERIAPLNIREHYDNCGLLIGHPDEEVHKILLCLDVTEDVLDEAVAEQCDLIISHHPMIFFGVKKIDTNSLIYKAIERHIAIYAAHTNLDSANYGVSTILAEKLGLQNLRTLRNNPVDDRFGFGAIGEFAKPLSELDFLDLVKNVCKIPMLKHSVLRQRQIKTVALCGGAGGELLPDAIAVNADAYITADLKYHEFSAANTPILVVEAGHFESEQFAVDILYSEISKNFPTFAVQKTKHNTNFVNYR
ncbi:MAG: Nif3-like dinuclear metal center hexameric protein [Bacteroidales bacterium]|jgi:dinuclear metal center YbgI/SA1388 family protein|nr:Nif3-like dinuclear metal center hexameric protein [Bacteroidales bacterium]